MRLQQFPVDLMSLSHLMRHPPERVREPEDVAPGPKVALEEPLPEQELPYERLATRLYSGTVYIRCVDPGLTWKGRQDMQPLLPLILPTRLQSISTQHPPTGTNLPSSATRSLSLWKRPG